MRTIVPIGFLYAGTLWLGNAAYVYLSVSFIQMLKVRRSCRRLVFRQRSLYHGLGLGSGTSVCRCELVQVPGLCVLCFFSLCLLHPSDATHRFLPQASMPVAVFAVGCGFGTEHFTVREWSRSAAWSASPGCRPAVVHLSPAVLLLTHCSVFVSQRGWQTCWSSEQESQLHRSEVSACPPSWPFLRTSLMSVAHSARRAPSWCQLSRRTASCTAKPSTCAAEINFIWIGVILQMASVATESTRLTLVQILLQVQWAAIVGQLICGKLSCDDQAVSSRADASNIELSTLCPLPSLNRAAPRNQAQPNHHPLPHCPLLLCLPVHTLCESSDCCRQLLLTACCCTSSTL